jgi:esterase/lipase superfamily enzyme
VEIGKRLAGLPDADRQAVIFIHGYNVSFEGAALRAAQIGVDLNLAGPMAFFSWPSQGTPAGYPADEATIEACENHIADYLSDFALSSGARRVNVIAHSMGNRGLLRAIQRLIGRAASTASGVQFGHFILAAPDVDRDLFLELSRAYGQAAQRTTLYISDRDRALDLSGSLHRYPRVGYSPPVTVVPGIDTVYVGNVDLTILGHGYVAEAAEVLRDMHELLQHDAAPDKRFALRRITGAPEGPYWSIRA